MELLTDAAMIHIAKILYHFSGLLTRGHCSDKCSFSVKFGGFQHNGKDPTKVFPRKAGEFTSTQLCRIKELNSLNRYKRCIMWLSVGYVSESSVGVGCIWFYLDLL